MTFLCILIIDCLPCGQDSLLCTAFYHRNTSIITLSPERKQKDGFLKRVSPSLFTVKCFSTRRDGRHTQSLGREAVESDRSVYVEETLSQFCQLLEIFKAYWKLGRHLTTIVLHPSFLFLMQHSVSYLLSQKTFLRCVCSENLSVEPQSRPLALLLCLLNFWIYSTFWLQLVKSQCLICLSVPYVETWPKGVSSWWVFKCKNTGQWSGTHRATVLHRERRCLDDLYVNFLFLFTALMHYVLH